MHKNTLILVVEDEDEIADILMSYLERSGMKTLRARQGEQAIALNRLHKPDLILLDIHLARLVSVSGRSNVPAGDKCHIFPSFASHSCGVIDSLPRLGLKVISLK